MPAEDAGVDAVDHGVVDRAVGGVSPPGEDVGVVEHLVGQTVLGLVLGRGAHLDVRRPAARADRRRWPRASPRDTARAIMSRSRSLFSWKFSPQTVTRIGAARWTVSGEVTREQSAKPSAEMASPYCDHDSVSDDRSALDRVRLRAFDLSERTTRLGYRSAQRRLTALAESRLPDRPVRRHRRAGLVAGRGAAAPPDPLLRPGRRDPGAQRHVREPAAPRCGGGHRGGARGLRRRRLRARVRHRRVADHGRGRARDVAGQPASVPVS